MWESVSTPTIKKKRPKSRRSWKTYAKLGRHNTGRRTHLDPFSRTGAVKTWSGDDRRVNL